MSKEDLSLIKLLVTEALVEEIISSPDFKSTEENKTSDIFMRKLSLLNSLGLSRFWTSEMMSYYAADDLDGVALCAQPILRMVLSFHARLMMKIALAVDEDARGFVARTVKEAILASTTQITGPEVLNRSLLVRENVYFYSVDGRLVEENNQLDKFISTNLWLGSIYLALATGAVVEISNETLKGK